LPFLLFLRNEIVASASIASLARRNEIILALPLAKSGFSNQWRSLLRPKKLFFRAGTSLRKLFNCSLSSRPYWDGMGPDFKAFIGAPTFDTEVSTVARALDFKVEVDLSYWIDGDRSHAC